MDSSYSKWSRRCCMELKKAPIKPASQFWHEFYKKKIYLIVTLQILNVLAFGAFILLLDASKLDSLLFWIIIATILTINIPISILILNATTKPTKDLMTAIIHTSGEKYEYPLPNPNLEYYQKTGLGDAINSIYKLASSQTATTDQTQQKQTDIAKMIDISSCGIVALDHNRNVIFSNKATPIKTEAGGIKKIDLLFNLGDTIDEWLDKCELNEVHSNKIWTRIPDQLPNQENRRFFDIIASYQKGAVAETVINLIDRTETYINDEENLDFLSFAAHELRGPITVIRGYLDVLEDELKDSLKEDQHELFHRLVVSSNRLSGYINNILNTSRYDRRHLVVHLNEDTVNNIYDMISDDMKLRASSQRRLLSVNIPPDLPHIAVDKGSMSEVFGNLIDNAIKYSREGGSIIVSAKTNGDFVDFSVQDNGIGMPDNVVSNLFQKFYRSHRSRETVPGTGIGLYISKAIVESHGGAISVRSEDGKGSIFTVSIPIYSTVADKLKQRDNSNISLINEGKGWINNHSMFRG